MITKIISGDQTGAGQAILDVVKKLGILYGTGSTIEHRITESDATLLISYGNLTGDLAFIEDIAAKLSRASLHINLLKTPGLKGAKIISAWVKKHQIETLNIEGTPAESFDRMKDAVSDMIEKAYLLLKLEDDVGEDGLPVDIPRTIEDAVDHLDSILGLRDKASMARMPESRLDALYFSIANYIKDEFRLDRNTALLDSCESASNKDDVHQDHAPHAIIKALWERLQKTHALRVVR